MPRSYIPSRCLAIRQCPKSRLMEDIAPEDQMMLLEDTPLEDETSLGQYWMEALTMLEVAGHLLGGRVHGTLTYAGKVRSQTPRLAKKEEKEDKERRRRQLWTVSRDRCNTIASLMLYPLLTRRKAPVLSPKSFFILVFFNKDNWSCQKMSKKKKEEEEAGEERGGRKRRRKKEKHTFLFYS